MAAPINEFGIEVNSIVPPEPAPVQAVEIEATLDTSTRDECDVSNVSSLSTGKKKKKKKGKKIVKKKKVADTSVSVIEEDSIIIEKPVEQPEPVQSDPFAQPIVFATEPEVMV